MEVSSHSLHQHRTTALQYACAVFTNLTGDHLDYHGTMEEYAEAKATLFGLLAPGATAIVNMDDPWHARMLEGCRAKVLRCSLEASRGAECRAEAGEATIAGTRVRYTGPWGSFEAMLGMVGRHNLMNTLQAIAAAWVMGVPASELEGAAGLMEAPPGRLERVTAPGRHEDFAVFVDYAHTDDALANVLRAARPLVRKGSALRVVFGCGGDRDRGKRPIMGEIATRLADVTIVTDDNPRSEVPADIRAAIMAAAPGAIEIGDRRQAIRAVVDMLTAGDTLVVAGKGHEEGQTIGAETFPFSDHDEVRNALKGLAA